MTASRARKWTCCVLCMILAACFLANPAYIRAAAAENAAESAEEPTGERHWYTFSILPWGLMSSTNVKYLALYGAYYVEQQNAVAIGKLKGTTTEVKVYTSDPEERLIWSYSPNNFFGTFLRSDVTLPDPDVHPDAGSLALVIGSDRIITLSDTAQAELAALRETIKTGGEPAVNSGLESSYSEQASTEVVFTYRELPSLGRWLLLSLFKDGDRLILLSWKQGDQASGGSGYEADRVIEVDRESELYRAACEAIAAAQNEAAGPEQP